MIEKPSSSGDGAGGRDDRRTRLAQALRQNLARRKAQSRARLAQGEARGEAQGEAAKAGASEDGPNGFLADGGAPSGKTGD